MIVEHKYIAYIGCSYLAIIVIDFSLMLCYASVDCWHMLTDVC